MWLTIGKIVLDILIYLISDKVLVQAAKKMLVKAVDSTVEKVGIDNKDAQDLIHTITSSTLNSIEDTYLK